MLWRFRCLLTNDLDRTGLDSTRQGLCAQAVAERMCELAYRMGTSDNVTAVVVQFHHYRPF